MENQIELADYLNRAQAALGRQFFRMARRNIREIIFIGRFMRRLRRSARLRREAAGRGDAAPLFLIASITAQCNLRCAGCYHHALRGAAERERPALDAAAWGRIFDEAAALGVGAILLAGGEPLLRTDVLRAAAARREMLFPVFSNGTLIDSAFLDFFDMCRNIPPVLSIEGGEAFTDSRRGKGIHTQVFAAMAALKKRRILFGVSVTVTHANTGTVMTQQFIGEITAAGARAVVFVEYIPADNGEQAMTLAERDSLAGRIAGLRKQNPAILILLFPGDEAESGGCLAAGRGFFHISAAGDAEPCPFAPQSDTNLREIPLSKALSSPLFTSLRENGALNSLSGAPCRLLGAK
ncbi:MAG: radical SAM protein [Spirochaetaceae bacterium]|jgi:MoaA/NifB/PqqE/SkfB family radical SAM enzyme|nr:radical SAM protein [Spirochaetaceae bacterium]